ncbi:hypothetical protein D3C85_797020 [compost metagenome]
MHHGIDIHAQVAHPLRVGEIALNELCSASNQVFDAFGPAPVDPHVQALLQGEPRKAPANETACAGDQNFHLLLLQMQLQASSHKLQVKNGAQRFTCRLQLDAHRDSNGTNHCRDRRTRCSVSKPSSWPPLRQ